MARWRVELMGGLRAEGGGAALTRFRTQKTGLLLAYLAYYRHRAHPRASLVELLWPGSEPHAGRSTLSRELSWLRDRLEPPGVPYSAILVADRFSARLNPDSVTTDVAEFEAALSTAAQARGSAEQVRALAQAVDLYRGELLAGYYESWIMGEQERLAELYFQALRRLLTGLEEAGDLEQAVAYARQGVRLDPLREEAQRDLMRLLAAVGQPAAALRQYRELERLLSGELGATPVAATCDLARAIEAAMKQDREAAASASTSPPAVPRERLESVGGATPLESAFYVVRPTDSEFRAAIEARDSIVLVKGARETGKSSLLARGLQAAREAGAQVVLTDFQALGPDHLASAETFYLTLAHWMAVQLELDALPREVWDAGCGPSINFQLYLRRQVLGKVDVPLVWGLDEVDRLCACEFGNEVFGLFRSWHNARSLDPTGPWSRLTLAMAYATEAHMLVADLNQSPFNVGTRLTLEDFTLAQVTDLNRRYGGPLANEAEIGRFFRLVGGQPYLVRRGLHEMAANGLPIASLEAQAGRETGPFANHLHRLLASLVPDTALCDVVRTVMRGGPCPTDESFYRLRSAGVLVGESPGDARPRCTLYAAYLERHLP
jgi:DNA-binding SARP family transcriptional activator